MDVATNRGSSHMGYYGPLAMGEFPSYNPREDRAAPNTQMVVTNSQIRCQDSLQLGKSWY